MGGGGDQNKQDTRQRPAKSTHTLKIYKVGGWEHVCMWWEEGGVL